MTNISTSIKAIDTIPLSITIATDMPMVIATGLAALASIFVGIIALHGQRKDARERERDRAQKSNEAIAELRWNWIQEVRSEMIKFSTSAMSVYAGSRNGSNLDLRESEQMLALMLDRTSQRNELIVHMAEMRKAAIQKKGFVESDIEFVTKYVNKYDKLCSEVLSEAWAKIKDDLSINKKRA